jgi:hypothetical protein
MADQDVQFKLKKLEMWHLSRNQIHFLDWLFLKSPNLIDLQIYSFGNDKEGRGIEI